VNDEPPQGGFVVFGRPICAARKIVDIAIPNDDERDLPIPARNEPAVPDPRCVHVRT
jgi:hypothetical protein